MDDPGKGWRNSDSGRFFEKHKIPILCGAALIVGLSFGGSGGANTDAPPAPIVIADPNVGSPDQAPGFDLEEWRLKEKRQEEQHDVFVDSVIREEQTCGNGKKISIHDTCPEE